MGGAQQGHARCHRRVAFKVSAVGRELPYVQCIPAHARHDAVLHEPGFRLHSGPAFTGNARRQQRGIIKAQIQKAGDRQPGQPLAGCFQQGRQSPARRQPGRVAHDVVGLAAVQGEIRVGKARIVAAALKKSGGGPVGRARIGKNQGIQARPFLNNKPLRQTFVPASMPVGSGKSRSEARAGCGKTGQCCGPHP